MTTCIAPSLTTIDPSRDPQWLHSHTESLDRQDIEEALRGDALPYGERDYERVGETCEAALPPPAPTYDPLLGALVVVVAAAITRQPARLTEGQRALEEWKRLRDEIDRLDPGNPLISRINVFVTALEAEPCRCGHLGDSPEPHPCHGVAYTCRKPAMERFYAPRLVCLAGVQPKVGARSTWACEECWEEFQEQLRDQQR